MQAVRQRPVDYAITPELFAEKGWPPILVSPSGLYSGFHIERYRHQFTELDAPPIRPLVVLSLSSFTCSLEQGRRSQQYRIEEGSIGVLEEGCNGRWKWNGVVDVAHLRMEADFLPRFAWEQGSRVELKRCFQERDERASHIVLALLSEVEAGSPGGRLFGEGMATAMAAHLLSNYTVLPTAFKKHSCGLSKASLKRVTDYIDAHLDREMSVETLASLTALSPFHFCRMFKQSTGRAPHQYVIERRVDRAKSLLLRGELTVSQVAVTVGFTDQSHLGKYVKRLLGVTPKQLCRTRDA